MQVTCQYCGSPANLVGGSAIYPHRNKTRRNAYKWLSSALGIPAEQTHIGMFDVAMCEKVVEAVKCKSN